MLVVLGELDEAVRRFETAVALEPEDASQLCNLGWGLLAAGRLEDAVAHYYLRPIDRKRLARLEEQGDYEELDRYVRQHNFERLEGWKWRLLRRREPPGYQELYKSLRAFFRFVEDLSPDSYTLYEDLSWLSGRFRRVMHKFIFKMAAGASPPHHRGRPRRGVPPLNPASAGRWVLAAWGP